MSKERLKNIDENKELNVCGITGKPLSVELSIKEYSYLYTQAERVQELEKDVSEWKIVNEQWEKINTSLVEQNKRYHEALENIVNSDWWLIKPNPFCTIEEVYEYCVVEAQKAIKGEE